MRMRSEADRRPVGVRIGRVVVALLLVGVWITVARFGGPAFGTISAVTNNDQASYLPSSAESTKVQALESGFFGSDSVPAVVLFVRDAGLTPADRAAVTAEATRLRDVAGVAQVAGPIPSGDGKALELVVAVESSADDGTVVGAMRASLDAHRDAGLDSWVTGPAGFGADFGAGFGGIDGVLLIVALAAVLAILLVVYRSLLLPLVVLATSAFALTASIAVVYLLAKAGAITVTGQSRGILAILAIGAATDYSLLLVSRYREALIAEPDRWRAILAAWRRAIEPIAASAATVILAVLCLGFSDLASNKGLGPVAAIAIAFAFLSSVTALPAALALLGRPAFWPRVPRPGRAARGSRLWGAVGRLVARRPRTVWVALLLLLGGLASGLSVLHADGVPQSDLLLIPSQSAAGQTQLAKHYDAGSGSPVLIVVRSGAAATVTSAADATAGVVSAATYPVGETGASAPAKVVDGRVLIEATLSHPADSAAAQATVVALRDRVRATGALVGGTTAIDLDSNTAAQRDLRVIVPIVLAVIFVVLALLLRSLVAPVVLIATVALSYGASLGVAAVVFDAVLRFPGADPSVPLFGFVFLVALGVDYNIFLMTRVREEAVRGTADGVIVGLRATGGMITSAGVVLAATFAALSTIPILFLVQIAFLVSFGVLLDTILVRSLLVPALAVDIGRALWWPSRLSRNS